LSKRPSIDLMSLTSEQAAPMPEAVQRMPVEAVKPKLPAKPRLEAAARPEPVKTENLEALAFKVSPVFRKRFRQRAVAADLKLNELLFEALDAWEEKHGLKR
jgi:3-methyladenine DNA glycosylase AlkC